MSGNIGSNDARFTPFNRGYAGGNLNIAGGSFNGTAPGGFGGVGSFGSNTGITPQGFGINNFNSLSNPYAGGANIGGLGQAAYMIGAAIPGLIAGLVQGIQAIFQGRREHADGQECGPCQGGGHDNNSGHPDMSAYDEYIDGSNGHRIDESGVNMSFEMDY